MGNRDFNQPREVTKGYFIQAEMLKDFIDYLFDVEEIGDYSELWDKFIKWEEEQYEKRQLSQNNGA